MARQRRFIKSGKIYEICFRARKGLPLPPIESISVLIESILARVQRDEKVEIIAHIWMANHPHIIIRTHDALQATRFYGEVKKQLTEAIKRLLGLAQLNIWEDGGTAVIELPNPEDIKEKIVYAYLNPAEAQLEDSIDKYPGVNSWRDFLAFAEDPDAEVSKWCPWIRQPMIPRLPGRSLSPRQDRHFAFRMRSAAKESHPLVIRPNAWMKCFIPNPTVQDITEANRWIIERVREREQELREKRQQDGKRVIGAKRLRETPILKPHTPKKRAPRIFVQTRDKALRMFLIGQYKQICEKCAECYRRWRAGDHSVTWPPGTFRPPIPPLANALG